MLAATEFLQGTELDEFQGSLLDTINACGRTLLDTMNQVLDFSKIVSQERSWRHIKRHKASPLEVRGMEKVQLDTYVATDLGVLAEEVVEGVCLGHAYGRRATASADQPVVLPHTKSRDWVPEDKKDPNTQAQVELIMDIRHNDWIYRTQPGAVRRILMNVLGNAMKYTDFGRISVRLEVTKASEGRSRRGSKDLVTLTVTDTGKGISNEFMHGLLYTPFAQEDSLAVGTGLGMSIVRSLVRALNGSLNTYSRPGEGTMVKVTLPLERPQEDYENTVSPPPQPSDGKDTLNQTRMLRDKFAGRRVAIPGVDPVNAAQHPLWSIITRYVTEWYGLRLDSWLPTAPTDLVLVDEQILSRQCEQGLAKVPSLLVRCNSSVDYGTARLKWSHLTHFIEMIRHPLGPHKLARCIRKCLESVPAPEKPIPMSISLPERPKPDTLSPNASSFGAKQLDLSGAGVELTPELTTGSGASTTSWSELESPGSYDSTSTISPQLLLAPSPSHTEAQPPAPAPTSTGLPRVLVVDDNSINLNLMLMFLKKRKMVTLDSAKNGKTAVESVEKIHGYDIIFLDMSMPIMDGFEAARTIRAMEKERDWHRWATIVALTGLSSPQDESDALASGVDLFLTKPVSFKAVARLLDKWEGKAAPT